MSVSSVLLCSMSMNYTYTVINNRILHARTNFLAAPLVKDSVTVDMFKIDLLDHILALYNKSVQRIDNEREQGTSVPVYLKLRDHFPHFTPCKSDMIVYATVEEGQSATKDDVIKYQEKLK